jgi:hypothetical protein
MLFPFDPPPGVVRNGTRYQSQGRFYDADLWRWHEGRSQPIGGWRNKSTSLLDGKARAILTWADNSNQSWAGIGTHSHLYAMTRSGAVTDISPIRADDTLGTDPFATTDDSSIVTVTHTAHGAAVGARAIFDGAAAVAGLTIDGEYEILTVPDANSYTIDAGSDASSTTTGGGASVDVEYTYNPGAEDASLGAGYGSGTYGSGTYGTPRPDSNNIIPPTVWTLDTWGENLIGVNATDQVIVEWSLNTSNRAAAIANAPDALALLSTEERSIFALGADGDPRAVAWCDLEDNTDWTPSGTNQAGDDRLQTNGRLMCGKRIRGGALVFTDVDVHFAEYVGLPQVYRFSRLATGCGVASRQSVAVVDGRAFWWGPNGFWMYDGAVQPLDCDVSDFLLKDLNETQAAKIYAVHNSQFGEVWWLYPSTDGVECDRYVIFDYRDGHWNMGALARTCGTDKSVFAYPLMVGTNGRVHDHEVGNLKDGRQPYAETGPVEIGDGERTMLVRKIIPDEEVLGDVAVSFTARDWPMSSESEFGPFTLLAETDVLFNARSVMVKYLADADKDFRVGKFRFDAKAGPSR